VPFIAETDSLNSSILALTPTGTPEFIFTSKKSFARYGQGGAEVHRIRRRCAAAVTGDVIALASGAQKSSG